MIIGLWDVIKRAYLCPTKGKLRPQRDNQVSIELARRKSGITQWRQGHSQAVTAVPTFRMGLL